MILRPVRDSGRRRGQIAIFIALSIVAIVSTLAISLDGGTVMSERRHAQATADAAALSAASDLYYNYWANKGVDSGGTGKTAALAAAAENGYANDGTDSTVTVNIPPKSGAYAGRAGYAEAIVQYNQPRGFSSLFGPGRIAVIARAVGVGLPREAYTGVLVLNPTDKDSLSGDGKGSLTVHGTPVIVNSSHSGAAIAGGGASLTAPEFDITGGYSANGGGSFNGPVYTGRPPTEDPLKWLPVPDPSKLTVQSNKKEQHTSGTVVLYPGVYKGGISVSGDASLELMPGIYYMDEGGFSFSGKGNLRGDGVMIYNKPGNGNSDGIDVSGQGSISLNPMEDGIYKGLTFWQERSSSVSGQVTGNGTTTIYGTFYFAGAELKVSGNGDVKNLGSQYISDKLKISGNGKLNVTWDPEKVALTRLIRLVE